MPTDGSRASSVSSLARCSADNPTTRASAVRLRARARPAMAMRSTTAAPGKMMRAVRRAAMTAAAMSWPRSVPRAASAAASIIGGTSAMVGVRRPKVAASWRAWSVMVCGRRAYSAKAAAGTSIWPAIQVTRAPAGRGRPAPCRDGAKGQAERRSQSSWHRRGVRPRGSGRPGTRSGITHEISSRLCIKIYGYPARSLSM